MADTRIDISAPVAEMLKLLDINPDDVSDVMLYPGVAAVTVYLRNVEGAIYQEDGVTAKETLVFKVVTNA